MADKPLPTNLYLIQDYTYNTSTLKHKSLTQILNPKTTILNSPDAIDKHGLYISAAISPTSYTAPRRQKPSTPFRFHSLPRSRGEVN